MKPLIVFSVFALFALLHFVSCSKGTGCTDQTATNYNPNATTNDGSCVYDGNVVFWTNNLSFHGGTLTVTLDDGQSSTITANYSVAPGCASTIGGCIMSVPKGSGTHAYTTKDGFSKTTSGTVVIAANTCTQQQLN